MKFLVLEQSTMRQFEILKAASEGKYFLEKVVSFNNNKVLRGVRKFLFFKLNIKSFFFRKWIPLIRNVDCIILFDTIYTVDALKFINSNFPQKRVVVYYWNSIFNSIKLENFLSLKCEIWSYDRIQCEKFALHYNPTFLFDFRKYVKNKKIDKKVFYIGKDKGRSVQLAKFSQELDENNIDYSFYIVGKGINKKGYVYLNKVISYLKMLEMMSSYKCVLDINASDSTGMTLRPLEALYFRKKLITFNKEIINTTLYKYNNKNIFVYGLDNDNSIYDFINSDYVEPNSFVYNYYLFESRLKRFDFTGN